MLGFNSSNIPLVGTGTNPSTGRSITSTDIKKATKTQESNSSFWKKIGDWWNDVTGASAAMEHEANQAQLQREHDLYMSNTSLQRGVEDANKAGLNAAMLYSNSASSGASTPSSTTARGHTASGNVFNILSSTINSAANLARSFNYDNNHNNDVNLRQVLNTVSTAARLFK